MKGFVILWAIVNLIAFIASLISIHYSPNTIFEFPYFHMLSILSLFGILNIPFYTAYGRMKNRD